MRNTILLVLLAACGDSATQTLDPDLAVDVTTMRCVSDTPCTSGAITIDRFSSSHELDTMLAGAWLFCGPASYRFGAGFELTPEHELYVLAAAEDGACRRASGPTTWYTLDISEQNPPGTYQLVLDWDEDGTTSFVPQFSRKATGMLDAFFDFEFRRLH